jgi:hypothetical protein
LLLFHGGLLYLSTIDNVNTEIPLASIPRGSTCQIYQNGGYFQLRCFTIVGGVQTEHFNSINAYSTALGSVDFFGQYNFRSFGSKTSVSVNFPAIGQVVTMTKDIPYGVVEGTKLKHRAMGMVARYSASTCFFFNYQC